MGEGRGEEWVRGGVRPKTILSSSDTLTLRAAKPSWETLKERTGSQAKHPAPREPTGTSGSIGSALGAVPKFSRAAEREQDHQPGLPFPKLHLHTLAPQSEQLPRSLFSVAVGCGGDREIPSSHGAPMYLVPQPFPTWPLG